MYRKRLTLIALAALALVGGGWFFLLRSPLPTYEGKTVSYWFKEYYRPNDDDEREVLEPLHRLDARVALDEMGTNALPYLVEIAFAPQQDTAFRTNFYDFLSLFPETFHAQKFVSWNRIRSQAVEAIQAIKPPTGAMLPLIQRELEETNSPNHYMAIVILGNLSGDADIRVPYLAKALHDSDNYSKMKALSALDDLGGEAKAAIPDLMALLESKSRASVSSRVAAGVLGQMGSNAAPAVSIAFANCF